MDKKEIGKKSEDFVSEYLKSKNYEIIERNWFCPYGEIDIIAKDGKEIVFVEVRCRKSASPITPSDTLTYSKQQKILSSIELYISENRLNMFARFDFVGVIYTQRGDNISFQIDTHLIGADLCG